MNTLRIALLGALLGLVPLAASAQYDDVQYYNDYAFDYEPYSGDREFDAEVAAVNALVGRDFDGFIEDLAYQYGAPRVEVRRLVVERHYPPDYLWTVAATARAADRPWNEVFPMFEQQRLLTADDGDDDDDNGQGHGWGVTAKRLGIKPGSPAFHALKNDLRVQKGKWKNKPRKTGATMTAQRPAAIRVDAGKGHGKGKGNAGKGKDKGAGKAKGKGKNK